MHFSDSFCLFCANGKNPFVSLRSFGKCDEKVTHCSGETVNFGQSNRIWKRVVNLSLIEERGRISAIRGDVSICTSDSTPGQTSLHIQEEITYYNEMNDKIFDNDIDRNMWDIVRDVVEWRPLTVYSGIARRPQSADKHRKLERAMSPPYCERVFLGEI
jgi:hypothetical protein